MTTNTTSPSAANQLDLKARRSGLPVDARWGLGILMLLALGSPVLAQETPPGGGPPSGANTSFATQPKMLSALPPPPADAPPPVADLRDFEGTWAAPPPFPPPQPPAKLTPQALETQQRLLKLQQEGTPVATNAGHCRPMDNITVGWDLFPATIVQTPREVVVFEEEGRGRWQIHLDRGHPTHSKPSYWGDSVGHWEGDTLVVDTVGFSGQQEHTTAQTHRVSRIHRTHGGRQLEMTVTTTDPSIYLEPTTSTFVSDWHPELQVLEFQCEENPEGALEGLTSQ
jgi:hypothetical protein